MKIHTESKNCYLYVLNKLVDWEIGYIIAELSSKRYTSNDKDFNLIIVADTTEPISTMGGIKIKPERPIAEVNFKAGDILVLPGSDQWFEDSNKNVKKLLPYLIEKKIVVAAICGATVALAQSGVLNSRKHTSNDISFLTMTCSDYTGNSLYMNKPVVVYENLITATGLAPLEFSYELFKSIKAMKEDTLEAWYKLYETRKPEYYYALAESLK